jgi:uroporphyrinogen decarboxylase
MKPRDIVLEQIQHRETHPVPYSLGFEGDIAERLDGYYHSREWRERLIPYMVRIGGIDTVQQERVDDVHVRDVFGGLWRDDRRPWHLVEPVLKEPSLANYAFPSVDRFLADVDEIVADALRVRAEKPDSFHIVSIGWGLFEHSWRIRGFQEALMDAVTEPDFYGELLDQLTELFLAFVAVWADVPADAIMFGDDWGFQQGVLLGPDRWRTFIKPRWAKVYEAVHAQGKLAISHCCGSIVDIMPDIIEIGLDVLESVQPEARGMNPYDLKHKWGSEITFWGCLGSQSTVQFGSPADIRDEVGRLCREMGKGGGYILAPAKSLQPGTPIENAAAVVEAFTGQENER